MKIENDEISFLGTIFRNYYKNLRTFCVIVTDIQSSMEFYFKSIEKNMLFSLDCLRIVKKKKEKSEYRCKQQRLLSLCYMRDRCSMG